MKSKHWSAIMQIVNKLHWNDMPVVVALDAVEQIIENYISGYNDCMEGEDSICEDSALDLVSKYLDEDNLWLSLFIYDYDTLIDTEMQGYALALRGDIESFMRGGDFFSQARREFDI